MKSDHHSLKGAGNQNSTAPLSTVTCPVTREQCSEPRCCAEGMCQISDVHPSPSATPEPIAHGKAIHAVRGNELERQLAKCREDCLMWKRLFIRFAILVAVAWVIHLFR